MGREQNVKLRFDYLMEISYSEPVGKDFFTIKGRPLSNARQQVLEVKAQLRPETIWSEGRDSFGNHQIYGCMDGAHSSFYYHVSGLVQIGQILYEEKADENEILKYRHPYGMNRPGTELRQYFETIRRNLEENSYVNAVYLMRRLHQDFGYQQNMTNVKTTAEEAWKLRQGVCQDYAHIFLALCHLAGIPARYVTGLIVGEGASHAWVEILYRNKWIGMDPTNDVLVARSHIKLGHGRDASDCQINRGILRGGGGMQTQRIAVSVTEAEKALDQKQQ